MARDWFKKNNGQGNVLKTLGSTVTATGSVTLDANINVIQVVLDAGAITLTGVSPNAQIGDQCILTGGNVSGGSLDLVLAGDFAAGTVSVGAGGVFSVLTVFNGTNFSATVTPV
tara:strand:+ start:289 stop:630 length:342 start_codon:yes stop_codon:yes gene_type:complete